MPEEDDEDDENDNAEVDLCVRTRKRIGGSMPLLDRAAPRAMTSTTARLAATGQLEKKRGKE
jgi:hypothetical protein